MTWKNEIDHIKETSKKVYLIGKRIQFENISVILVSFSFIILWIDGFRVFYCNLWRKFWMC